jgi:hypothetical protein
MNQTDAMLPYGVLDIVLASLGLTFYEHLITQLHEMEAALFDNVQQSLQTLLYLRNK